MQSNSPVPNFNYSISNAGNSTSSFITVFNTVDPTSNDYNYQIKTRWINTVTAGEWILLSYNSISSVTTANWLQLGSGESITEVNIQIFTVTGSYIPTPGMNYCIVECVGGGGGGGGAAISTIGNLSIGGGGGSGAYGKGVFTSSEIGTSQDVTIGAAGSAGANTGGTGGTGGSTIFGTSPLITCTGGTGGVGSIASTFISTSGGNGGSSSGSGLSIGNTGTPGGVGFGFNTGSGFVIVSGFGGNSFLGAGGKANNAVSALSSDGNFGLLGGGGSGGLSNASSAAIGGVGGSGLIIITEFISI